MVDLYPLALHVNSCDLSGRASGRERLVLTSHHVLVRDVMDTLAEALDSSRLHGLRRGLTLAVPLSLDKERNTVNQFYHTVLYHTIQYHAVNIARML